MQPRIYHYNVPRSTSTKTMLDIGQSVDDITWQYQSEKLTAGYATASEIFYGSPQQVQRTELSSLGPLNGHLCRSRVASACKRQPASCHESTSEYLEPTQRVASACKHQPASCHESASGYLEPTQQPAEYSLPNSVKNTVHISLPDSPSDNPDDAESKYISPSGHEPQTAEPHKEHDEVK